MTDENTDPQTAGTEPTVPDWLLPNRAYDVLKWVALIVLPGIGVLVQTLGPVWGWTWADPAATTINAVALTIGVVIGASTLKARASKPDITKPPNLPHSRYGSGAFRRLRARRGSFRGVAWCAGGRRSMC